MADLNLDFGDGVLSTPSNGGTPSGSVPDITGATAKTDGTDITNQDGNKPSGGETTPPANKPEGETTPPATPPTTPPAKEPDTTSSTGELEPGTVIEFDGTEYTVAENGDIVDKDGKVFKEAKDVDAWLKENEQVDDNSLDGVSIKDLIAATGIEITDENGKPVDFTDDKEGFKSYMNSVIEFKVNEANQATLNKFYQDNPIVKQFVDYLTVNGGDYRGFGQLPDRSGITIDKDNQNQQEQIIRMAGAEFGMNVTDAYIKYLRDSGGLYDEAVNQLQALVDKDKQVRTKIEQDAATARAAEEKAVREYWENVGNVIKSRNIAGYKIPESFVKEVNGQKVTLTPDDFMNYLYRANQVDANGNKVTAYQRDLDKLTDEELLNQELLSAYLMFTGGTYKDLADMAIKENEVRKLIVKSRQQRTSRTIKINKPQEKGNINDIVFE